MNIFSNHNSGIARGNPFTNNPLYFKRFEFPVDVLNTNDDTLTRYENNGNSRFNERARTMRYNPGDQSRRMKINMRTPDNDIAGVSIPSIIDRKNEMTLFIKYKVYDQSLLNTPLFGFETPFYEIRTDKTSVGIGGTVTFSILISSGPVNYTISGVSSADLNGADLAGTLNNVETVLSYTIVSGDWESIIFSLDGLGVIDNTELTTSVTVGYREQVNTTYNVTVLGTPAVFYIEGTEKLEVPFIAGQTYIFDQSDSSNTGEQLVFGTTSDDKINLYTIGVTTMGTPGQSDAFTQIDVPDPAPSPLYYYSLNRNGMGFGGEYL
jgi:hypothetical protein